MTVNFSKDKFNLREKLKELERPSVDKLITKDENGAYIDIIRGNTKLESIDSIIGIIGDTVTDVFVYDTSKDSDGGAWRKRTQHTSWYNETLNTATRGSRKEFPAVAVIVAETTKVAIYDGDDPDLPMWMVFNVSNTTWFKLHSSGSQCSCISALNATLCAGGNGTGIRLAVVDFVKDNQYLTEAGYTYYQTSGIITRNDTTTHTSDGGSKSIVNNVVNDVAMTVLPNAPIDIATGLPTPTIAVATDGGVSVIKNDGTVVDITGTSQGADAVVDMISFVGNDKIMYSHRYASEVNTISSSNVTAAYYNQTSTHVGRITNSISHDDDINVSALSSDNNIESMAITETFAASKSVSGLSLANNYAITSDPDRASCFITTDYNTGWMQGDIKGAFLSDTTVETMSQSNATELVTNGTSWTGASGTTPPNGWTSWGYTGSAFTIDSGTLRIGNSAVNNPTAMYQTVTTVVGQVYTFYFSYQVTNAQYAIIRVGTGSGLDGGLGFIYGTVSGAQTSGTLTFVATNTATNISVQLQATSGNATINIDNFSIKAVGDIDRSVNNNGLAVFGTIVKTPVATGAELVAYSGFSGTNVLRQPPNSDMNLGTSDAYIMAWYKTTSGSGSRMVVAYEGGANGTSDYGKPFNIRMVDGRITGWASHDGFASYNTVYDELNSANGQWHCAVWVRSGTNFFFYKDGERITHYAGTGVNEVYNGGVGSNALSDANTELVIGARKRGEAPGSTGHTEAFPGSIALARIGKSAPSAGEVKKMYNDEKHLFQENAKATLYGSSNAVTALAFDEVTDQLHVGTSSGRSDFQGLRRINNTTTAVTTAISAHDEFIIEQ